MSDGDREDGGSVLPFVPRVVLPRSFDAPEPDAEDDGLAAEEPAAVSTWPRLPEVAEMRPPLHLTVPGVPKVEPAPADEEAGIFSPPAPEDPDAPTVGETLAVAVALLTALGVAAARAVWQRAQERQARAERARGGAGKASGGGDGAGSGGRRTTKSAGRSGSKGSSSPSLLRSPGGTSPKKKPPGPSGGPKGRGGGSRPHGGGKGSGGSHGGSRKGRADGKGGPGSKAGRDGRRKDREKPGRKKNGADKGDIGKRVRRGVEKLKRPRGADKTTPDSKKPSSPRGRKLTWRAKRRPGPGDDKAITRRKRWTGRTGNGGKTASGKRRGWRSGVAWLKRWRAGRTRAADETPSTTTASEAAEETTEATAQETGTPKTPPPPPGFGGMRPPPGADRRTWVTVERVYPPPPPPRRSPEALAGAPAAGRLALPAGTAGASAEDAPPPAPQEGPPVSTLRMTGTQYRDADLTIYDVIEADADMAAEIGDGSAEARATAEGCELLLTRLETLHAEIVALGVPGVLEGLLVLLMDKTLSVKAKAEAIAAGLPAAAEAISVAGTNAESRHRPLADVTRDMGHVRPAAREYHDE